MKAWTENYNIHNYYLISKALKITIKWTSEPYSGTCNGRSNKEMSHGYMVTIGDRRLKILYGDLPSAKMASIRFSEKLFFEMQTSIENLKKEETNASI